MSYHRVIPRDLFNEANLLKCYGRLYIALDNLRHGRNTSLTESCGRAPFDIQQDESDGSLTITNVSFTVRGFGVPPYRPLNARGERPLWAVLPNEEHMEVFSGNGNLSSDMLAFISNPEPV